VSRPLSQNVAKAVEKLFPDENKAEVVRYLTEHCADNIPGHENYDEYDLEDLRFECLRRSKGDFRELRWVVLAAESDWRDVLPSGRKLRRFKRQLLGSDLEPNPKSDATWRAQTSSYLIFWMAFVTFLSLRLFEASHRALFGAAILLVVAYVVHFFVLMWHKGEKIWPVFWGMAGLVGMPVGFGFLVAYIIRWMAGIIRST